jgi:predicted peptidase
MRRSWIVGVLIGLTGLLSAGCGSNPSGSVNKKAPPNTGFSVREIKLSDGAAERYSVFIPFNYDPKKPTPTIVFLHGIGEGGSNGTTNTTVGLGPAIAKNPAKFGFIAIFPQSGGTWSGEGAQKMAIEILDATARQYNVDPARVYLTGLSTGGYGTWAIGAKYANRFAAIAPMCAYSGVDYADKLTRMPVWAFHNSGDPFVLASSTKSTVKKINQLGGNAKQSIYGGLGHNCWDRAYKNDDLFRWMLSHRKS